MDLLFLRQKYRSLPKGIMHRRVMQDVDQGGLIMLMNCMDVLDNFSYYGVILGNRDRASYLT